MNLTQIHYFLAIAEKLNFTAAAKSLYVSQPALSKQMTLLEEEIGTKLFERSNRKVALTKAGASLQTDLQRILVELDAATNRAKKIGLKKQRHLKVGCFDGAILNDYLPEFAQLYRNLTPDNSGENTRLEMTRGNFAVLRKLLRENELDFIFTLAFETPTLKYYKHKTVITRQGGFIFSKRFFPPEKTEICLEDFHGKTLFHTSRAVSEGAYKSTTDALERLHLQDVQMEEVNDMSTLLTYLEMGEGFAILSEDVIRERSQLRCFHVAGEFQQGNVIVAWNPDNQLANRIMEQIPLPLNETTTK